MFLLINYFSVFSRLETNLCTIAMILFILRETADSAGAQENILNIFLLHCSVSLKYKFYTNITQPEENKNYQEVQFARPFSVNVSFLKKA